MGLTLLPTAAPPKSDLQIERTGTMIGRYKLLEKIGEGGFGVVFMAEQVEPVRRQVALKIIKAGMDTREVIARFEAERQAIALMDHPNIARALDAGATEAGRPYFVMELVRGIPITDYCDQNHLPTRERLQLFIKVCQAVQHAHQKGVIHRDIKPSNVLVTLHDGEPVPKVIDFGVAKALGQKLTEKTLFTAFNHMIGTPAYMSPEQAALSGLDIDTRADIYSLGILLYELLTGVTPFDTDTFRKAALDEIRRMIRETEPPKPSTRLQTLGEKLTDVAERRHTEPAALSRLIRGDLDWIVMKCLEKDRQRRYETANGLAADVARHLNSEPVVARAPGNLYRFQKLVRRNKLAFAAGGAVFLALLLGVIASTLQAVRATRSEREQSRLREAAQQAQANEAKLRQKAEADEKKAQTEAAKATAISDFLQQMLGSANPDNLKGSEYTVRQLLDDFSAGLANQLEDQPEVEAAVRATIGRAYLRFHVTDKAQAHHERALTLRRRIFGDQAEPVAESLVDCAWSFFEQQQYAKGEPYVREALEIYRKRGTAGQPVLYALWALQKILSGQGRVEDLETVTEEAMTIAGKSPGVEFPEMASMIHGLAEMKNGQSKHAEAESLARKAFEMHRRLRGAEHPETAWALLSLGSALRGQQKLTDAEVAFQEALRIFRKYYSSGHGSVDMAMSELKSVLEAKGDSAGLEALTRQRFDDANKRIERNAADAEAWIERALGHVDLKLWQAALADFAEAIARIKDANPKQRAAVAVGCLELAQRAYGAAQHETSERASRQAIPLFQQLVQDNPQGIDYPKHLGHSQWHLAQTLRETGRSDQAEQVVREALKVFETAARNFPAEPYFRQEQAGSRRLLGEVLSALGQVDETVRHFRVAIDLYAALAADVPQKAFYRQEEAYATWSLAVMLERAGRPDAAAVEYRQAIALYEKAIAKFPNEVELKSQLADLLREQGKLAEVEALLRDELVLVRTPDTNAPSQVRPRLGLILHHLADVLRQRKALKEARALADEASTLYERHPDWPAGERQHAFRVLTAVLTDLGDFIGLEALLREDLIRVRKLSTNGPSGEIASLGVALHHLADVLRERKALTEARSLAEEAVAVYQRHPDWPSNERQHALQVLTAVLKDLGDFAGLEALYREALATQRKLLVNENLDIASLLNDLALVLKSQGKLAEVETLYREELALQRKQLGNEHPAVGASLSSLGEMLRVQGKLTEAEALFREAIILFEQLVRKNPKHSDHPLELGHSQWRLADALSARGRKDEAEQVLRESLQVFANAATNFPDVAFLHLEHGYSAWELAGMLEGVGRLDAAEAEYRHAIALHKKASADFPNQAVFAERLGTLNVRLVELLRRRGRLAEAKSMYREAAERGGAPELNAFAWSLATGPDPNLRDGTNAVVFAEKAVAATNRKNAGYLDTLAAAYAETAQFAKAISIQQEAIALPQSEQEKQDLGSRLKLYENNSPYRDHGSLAELTRNRLLEGKFAEAERLARECLAIREREIPGDWRTFNSRSMLGGSLLGQKKYAEAEPLLLSGYEGMKQREAKIPAVGKPRVKETLQRLVQLYEATGQSDKAAEWKNKLADFEKRPGEANR